MSRVALSGRTRALGVIFVAFLAGSALPTASKEPARFDDLQREMAIMQDVLDSTLRVTLRGELRVTGIEVDYLANQGVVISLEASRPLIGSTPEFHDAQGLEVLAQIPTMVEQILQDVEIYVEPYDPEDLQELRSLRDDQRRLRTEQRAVRSKLRDLRRRTARAEGSEAEELERRIESSEEELADLDSEYDSLDDDIDRAYDRIKDLRTRHQDRVVSHENESRDILTDALVGAVCDYGTTLKSLPNDEHINVVVRQRRGNSYLVFRRSDVVACQREAISVADLKERSFSY